MPDVTKHSPTRRNVHSLFSNSRPIVDTVPHVVDRLPPMAVTFLNSPGESRITVDALVNLTDWLLSCSPRTVIL